MKNFFYILLILFFAISCKDNTSTEAYSNDKIVSIKMPSKDESYQAVAADTSAVAADATIEESTSNLDKIEPQIIKNGDLRFETSDLEKTYSNLLNVVKKNKGIIQYDNEGKDYQTHFRNLTVRIPSINFDNLIKEISIGVNYFDRKEISSSDITEEYVDIISRIKTKKALELRYLELLNKASKVSEILEVEKELSVIREEIEAKEGRLKYIKDRVSMSTITIEIYKTHAEKSEATVSFGTKISNAIKSGFNSISSFFIVLLGNWPIITILVAIIYFVKKRFKKKIKNEE